VKRKRPEYRVVLVPPTTPEERRAAETRWRKAAEVAVEAALDMLDPATRAVLAKLPDAKRVEAGMLLTQAWLARPVHGPLEGEKKAEVERYLEQFLAVVFGKHTNQHRLRQFEVK